MLNRDYALHISVYADEVKDLLLVLKESVKSLKKNEKLDRLLDGQQHEDTFCAGEYAWKIVELFKEEELPEGIRYGTDQAARFILECGNCGDEFQVRRTDASTERSTWTCPWCGEEGEYKWI